MAWMKLETSVARNRKFVKAGPAPSWLWVCGLAYCQEGLTDGFIPTETVNYLGVKNAKHLAHHLVAAGLWDAVEGGWRVHDYLNHNRSAVEVSAIRTSRAAGGHKGGRPKGPSKEPSEIPFKGAKVSSSETLPQTFPVDVADGAAVAVVVEGGPGETVLMDVWFERLKQAYPSQRVTSGHLTVKAFCEALWAAPDGVKAAFARMVANLENQKRGHEWRVKGMIPKLQNWLEGGAWEQQHEESPPSVLVNDRTAGTLEAASVIMRGRS